MMELWLVDINPEVVAAWKTYFSGCENVFIRHADILSIAENTIVSPANGRGIMDGGIDLIYTNYFGLKLEAEVQKKIAARREGLRWERRKKGDFSEPDADEYLPVGAAVTVMTGNDKIPYMIAAPTMRDPGQVDKVNCWFAMSAILKQAGDHKSEISKVFCPGLGTLTGRVAPEDAAKEMYNAYKKWLDKQ